MIGKLVKICAKDTTDSNKTALNNKIFLIKLEGLQMFNLVN